MYEYIAGTKTRENTIVRRSGKEFTFKNVVKTRSIPPMVQIKPAR
jgi:hypothetical protein